MGTQCNQHRTTSYDSVLLHETRWTRGSDLSSLYKGCIVFSKAFSTFIYEQMIVAWIAESKLVWITTHSLGFCSSESIMCLMACIASVLLSSSLDTVHDPRLTLLSLRDSWDLAIIFQHFHLVKYMMYWIMGVVKEDGEKSNPAAKPACLSWFFQSRIYDGRC